MRNLVPIFIQKHINDNSGKFNSFVISCDISNFTPFLENLLKQKKAGAQQTGEMLNTTFGHITHLVYSYNGFITNFAGDAFTALFPNSNIYKILDISYNIFNVFNKYNKQNNKNLKIRLAISRGPVEWGIIGNSIKTYYFRGNGIKNVIALQQKSIINKICIDKHLINKVNKKYIQKKDNLYYIIDYEFNTLKLQKINISFQYNKFFFPDILSEINDRGEFRKTIPVFINFPSDINNNLLIDFVSFVHKKTKENNGYFNKLDFNEKGGIILVIFGAPYTFEKMAETSLIFAENIKKEFPHIKITIGADYGITYAGFIGSNEWQEYTVLGDIVNTASRLSSLLNGNINIGLNLKNEITNYNFKKLSSIKIKGKSNNIDIFIPLKRKQKSVEFLSPFVGREKEIKNISKLLNNGLVNTKHINISLEGESGIGKTRLIYNILNTQNIKYFYCASDIMIPESLGAIKQLFSQIMNFNLYESSNDKREKIKKYLIEHFNEQFETYSSYLFNLFSITDKHDIPIIDSKEKLQTIYFILREILKKSAYYKPFVIVFDDLMWADDDTIDFINYAFENNIKGIVCVFIFRETTDKIKHLKIKYQIFKISSFNKKGVKNFLIKYFNTNVSHEMVEILFRKTEGNPLFLEQIAIHIDSQKQIYTKNNQLFLKSDYEDLPTNIDRLIVSRLDSLSANTRDGIKKAAVIGKEFEILLLKIMLKKDIQHIIDEGEENKIIQIISKNLGVFRHTLLQEIAYKMQFEDTLKKIHKQVAQLYESIHKNDLSRYYETLYFHYKRAGLKKKTIYYLKKAIKKNIKSYSNDIAYNLIQEFLKMNITKKERILALIDAGNIMMHTSKYNNAYEYFNNAILLCNKICTEKAEAQKGIADIKWSLGDYDKALEFYNISLKSFEKLKNKKGMSRIYESMGIVYYNKGDYNTAFKYFNKAIKFADNDRILRNSILSNQGLVLYRQGELDKAMKYYNQALMDAKENDDLNTQAILHLRIGLIYNSKEDYRNSLKHNNISLRLNRKIGNRRSEAIVLGNIGQLYSDMGHREKGLKYLFKALEIDRDIKNLENETIVLGNIANFYAIEKNYDKSLIYYNEALKIDRKIGNRWSEAIDLGNMAEVYKLKGKYNQADKFFIKCISIVKDMNARHPLSHFLYKRAELHISMKKYKSALKLLKESKKNAIQINQKRLIQICNELIDKINK